MSLDLPRPIIAQKQRMCRNSPLIHLRPPDANQREKCCLTLNTVLSCTWWHCLLSSELQRSVCDYLPNYTASHLRSPQLSYWGKFKYYWKNRELFSYCRSNGRQQSLNLLTAVRTEGSSLSICLLPFERKAAVSQYAYYRSNGRQQSLNLLTAVRTEGSSLSICLLPFVKKGRNLSLCTL
jgi:hypothetical protein